MAASEDAKQDVSESSTSPAAKAAGSTSSTAAGRIIDTTLPLGVLASKEKRPETGTSPSPSPPTAPSAVALPGPRSSDVRVACAAALLFTIQLTWLGSVPLVAALPALVALRWALDPAPHAPESASASGSAPDSPALATAPSLMGWLLLGKDTPLLIKRCYAVGRALLSAARDLLVYVAAAVVARSMTESSSEVASDWTTGLATVASVALPCAWLLSRSAQSVRAAAQAAHEEQLLEAHRESTPRLDRSPSMGRGLRARVGAT